MKRKKAIDFLTVTLFFGILLSVMIYMGLGIALDFGKDSTDGETKGFNKIFFSDETLSNFVRFCDYRVFGHIDDSELIVGEDDWLFEATDSENGYERLLDYIGGCPYIEDELKAIAENIEARTEYYNSAGAEYILVVIPDSMTACEDKVPSYLGHRSENARLSLVNSYLAGEEHSAFLDPTESMMADGKTLPMYNNTENSINAYGAYCIYNSVISRFLADTGREVSRIHREDVDFLVHFTEGRSTASKVGLEGTVRNRTVSLSDEMPDNYRVVYNDRGLVITDRDGDSSDGGLVYVECSSDWDRVQLMPYFSNTFERVYYRNGLSSRNYPLQQNEITLVVQIIHEGELDLLLEKY